MDQAPSNKVFTNKPTYAPVVNELPPWRFSREVFLLLSKELPAILIRTNQFGFSLARHTIHRRLMELLMEIQEVRDGEEAGQLKVVKVARVVKETTGTSFAILRIELWRKDLWGKANGTERNYYIACSMQASQSTPFLYFHRAIYSIASPTGTQRLRFHALDSIARAPVQETDCAIGCRRLKDLNMIHDTQLFRLLVE